MATIICTINQQTHFIDLVQGAVTGPGTPGAPVVLNNQGVIDPSMYNLGSSAVAAASIIVGNLVNLYNVGGVLTARLASAAPAGSPAVPYVAQAIAITSGIATQTIFVSFGGIFTYQDNLSEFTSGSIGAEVYLSAVVPGGITLTQPISPNFDQSVGYVVGFNPTTHVVTAVFLAALSGTLPSSDAGAPHHFLTSYSAITGTFTDAQPAYTDISGLSTVAHTGAYGDLSGLPQLPITFTPVLSGSPPEYEYLTGYNAATGVFSATSIVIPTPNGLGEVQGNNAGVFAGIPGSVCDFTNGLISLVPTGTGVALTVKGDSYHSNIQEWYVHGVVTPAVVLVDRYGNMSVAPPTGSGGGPGVFPGAFNVTADSSGDDILDLYTNANNGAALVVQVDSNGAVAITPQLDLPNGNAALSVIGDSSLANSILSLQLYHGGPYSFVDFSPAGTTFYGPAVVDIKGDLIVDGTFSAISGNTDFQGSISSGASPPGTTVSKTFAVSYALTPTVIVTPTTDAGAFYLSSVSNSGFTITYANSGAQTFNYIVIGNHN